MGAGLEKRIVLADESATLELGVAWATILRPQNPPWIIFLKGDLGAGKTTLVRGFLRGMGYKDSVKSPTYTLVESYPFDVFDPLVYKPTSFSESRSGTYIPVFDDFPSLESTPLLGIQKNLLAGSTLYHFDLYRLSEPQALDFIGIHDYCLEPGLLWIEWPEQGKGFLPDPDLVFSLETVPEGRVLKVQLHSKRAQALDLERLHG